MSTLTTIQSTDLITNSRADINGNFTALNTDKMETSVLDTDTTLAADSDAKIPSQKAVKAYVDAGGNVNASETTKGIVEEATDAEVTAGTATGGTGAKLFVTPTKLLTYLATLSSIGQTIKNVSFSTIFETAGRFTSIVNSGVNTFNTTGLSMDTTVTGGRAAGVTLDIGGTSNNLFTGSPVFSTIINFVTRGNEHDGYFGLGLVTKTGAGHTYTTDHCGFKVFSTGATTSLYATQGNGTSETASSALTTLAAGDSIEVMLKVNGTTSIDYYWRKNGGTWSTATNLATNMPDTASYQMQFSVSNVNTAQQTVYVMVAASYSR